MQINRKKITGFTLLEILIALFIFTILSLLLSGALRSVINAQETTEKNAARLHHLQVALLLLSRDVEQAVNRPIINSAGKREPAFTGTPTEMVLTHLGLANPAGFYVRSSMQRVRYLWKENEWNRVTWPALDQAPTTRAVVRPILQNVRSVRLQYLAKNGRFYEHWPLPDEEANQPLPQAVRLQFIFSNGEQISALYVISAQQNSVNANANTN